METARIISSPALRFTGSGEGRSLKLPFRQVGNLRPSLKGRDDSGILSCEFSDPGHLQYYQSPHRGGEGKLKEKSKEMRIEATRKMKLIKRLSKDLDFFSRTAYGEEFGSRLIGEVKEKTISEATEVLIAEIEHLKLEQKEQKRKRKEKKDKLKESKAMMDSESSTSSSSSSSSSAESSDCDGDEVVDVRSFKREAYEAEQVNLADTSPQTQGEHKEMVLTPSSFSLEDAGEDCRVISVDECSGSNHCNGVESSGMKIAVCMGGKCKKMGAATLMEEFEKKIGTEGSVVSCKCMGKCKYGPNVKVSNGIQEESVQSAIQTAGNPLYLGVRLEDVGAIVVDLLSKDAKEGCLVATP